MGIARAIEDIKRFTTKEHSIECLFERGAESATVRAIVSKHNLRVDPNSGVAVNAPSIHLSVAETNLTDESFTTRDGNQKINMRRVKVTFTDAVGIEKTYLITEQMPDNTLGLLTFELTEYAA